MVSKVKILIGIVVAAIVGWVGLNGYFYFFSLNDPVVEVRGIKSGVSYSGIINCTLTGGHDYKISHMSVWLDSHPLINNFKIGKKNFSRSFEIDTAAVSQGRHGQSEHDLKVEVVAGTHNKNSVTLHEKFYVDNVSLQAAFVKPDSVYKVFQGKTFHIQLQVNKRIKEAKINVFSKAFACYQESKDALIYECFVPVECEEKPNEYMFTIDVEDYVGNKLTLSGKLQVVLFPFKKQRLTVSAEKVKEEQEIGRPSKELNLALEELWKKSPKEKLWKGGFCTPIDVVRTTCDYGSVRTTQQKGRYMHKALDVINTPKSVVWAPQNGIVVIKDRYVESGNTVVIDHGCGVFSALCHLDGFADIKEGEKVIKGNPVGYLGKTGYATGYHLHWAMFVDGVPVDPMQWVKQNF